MDGGVDLSHLAHKGRDDTLLWVRCYLRWCGIRLMFGGEVSQRVGKRRVLFGFLMALAAGVMLSLSSSDPAAADNTNAFDHCTVGVPCTIEDLVLFSSPRSPFQMVADTATGTLGAAGGTLQLTNVHVEGSVVPIQNGRGTVDVDATGTLTTFDLLVDEVVVTDIPFSGSLTPTGDFVGVDFGPFEWRGDFAPSLDNGYHCTFARVAMTASPARYSCEATIRGPDGSSRDFVLRYAAD